MSVRLEKLKTLGALQHSGCLTRDVHYLFWWVSGRIVEEEGVAYPLDVLADLGFQGLYVGLQGVTTGVGCYQIRGTLGRNEYVTRVQVDAATADYTLYKVVNGVATDLGTEAYDWGPWVCDWVKIQAVATSITAWRDRPLAVKISATDTSLASGHWADRGLLYGYHYGHGSGAIVYHSYNTQPWFDFIRAPASALPSPIAHLEVPITGTGKFVVEKQLALDPFRPVLPEEIVEKPLPIPQEVQRKRAVLERKGWSEEEIRLFLPEAFGVERINRLAVTWGALIPTDNSGKPIHGTCILNVFGGSSPELRTIDERIKTLTEMRGVRRLPREEAIDLALKMDDKLFIHDLVPCQTHPESPTSKCCKEHIDWREKVQGVKRKLIDDALMARYVKEEKW